MFLHDAFVAAVSAAVGAGTVPIFQKLWGCLKKAEPEVKPVRERFEPGVCDFHVKCESCGYEWAMWSADRKPPEKPKEEKKDVT